jgi:hypothetical protein
MHPDLDAIVAADVAARRDVDGLKQTLAEREAAERARQRAGREASAAEARARLEADVAAIQAEGRAALDARRAAKALVRAERLARADKATAAAVASYVRIVRGAATRGPGS